MLDFNDAKPFRVVDTVDFDVRLAVLREAISSRAHDLVATIFPNANIHVKEARIGSIDGEPGDSLAIDIQSGVWFDHATGEGGDAIDLWRATTKTTFLEAVDDLERWAGLTNAPRFTSRVHKVAEKRQEEARKNPKPADTGLGAPVASWQYYSAAGMLIGIVRRYDLPGQFDANGKPKKTFRPFTATGEAKMPDPRPLYRIPQIINASTVVLVEGEKCADALERVGIEATTVMGGAKSDPAKTDWSTLAGKTVLVWEDNDAAGAGLTERIRPSLEAVGATVSRITIPSGKPDKWDAADAVAEGEDIPAIIGLATSAPRRFKLLTVSDLESLEPLDWMVEGALPTGGFLGLYGPSGGLKSFVALDISLHVATGRDWHGRAVKRGPVVYVAGEGRRGLAKRVLGWRARYEVNPDDFRLVAYPVAVTTEEINDLILSIGDMPEKPRLIVLDTLARTFGAGDENSQQDMSAYVRACDRLAEVTGAAVMVVHHTGKDENRGLRGSNALLGALDTNIFVKRSGRKVELINEAPHGKQKDADEFETVHLVATPFAFDHKGEREGTLILMGGEADEGDEGGEDAPKKRRAGPVETAIMAALQKASEHDQGLKFGRLKAMVGGLDGSIVKALQRLQADGIVKKEGEEWFRS